MPEVRDPVFFASAEEFRAWLEEHHERAEEVWVGFWRKATGRPTMTWSDAVDEALCFGWIDGIRKRIDDQSYANRFTPRRPGSNWSAVNVRKVAGLRESGRMTPAGLRAYEQRREDRTQMYSYEQRHEARLDEEQLREFQANREAWAFIEAQPPGYRQTAVYWVASAKRPETRARRLETLIACSAAGNRLPQLS